MSEDRFNEDLDFYTDRIDSHIDALDKKIATPGYEFLLSGKERQKYHDTLMWTLRNQAQHMDADSLYNDRSASEMLAFQDNVITALGCFSYDANKPITPENRGHMDEVLYSLTSGLPAHTEVFNLVRAHADPKKALEELTDHWGNRITENKVRQRLHDLLFTTKYGKPQEGPLKDAQKEELRLRQEKERKKREDGLHKALDSHHRKLSFHNALGNMKMPLAFDKLRITPHLSVKYIGTRTLEQVQKIRHEECSTERRVYEVSIAGLAPQKDTYSYMHLVIEEDIEKSWRGKEKPSELFIAKNGGIELDNRLASWLEGYLAHDSDGDSTGGKRFAIEHIASMINLYVRAKHQLHCMYASKFDIGPYYTHRCDALHEQMGAMLEQNKDAFIFKSRYQRTKHQETAPVVSKGDFMELFGDTKTHHFFTVHHSIQGPIRQMLKNTHSENETYTLHTKDDIVKK